METHIVVFCVMTLLCTNISEEYAASIFRVDNLRGGSIVSLKHWKTDVQD
jgi:hypothetical protein